MKTINENELIIIDSNSISSSKDEIIRSIKEFGFICIRDEIISDVMMEEYYSLLKDFFSLPQRSKLNYSFDNIDQKKYSDVGYFPFKTEKAQNADLPDLKEMFHLGRNFMDTPMNNNLYAKNVYPHELPLFENKFNFLFDQFERISRILFLELTKILGFDLDYIENLIEEGNSLLRLIHYPPTTATDKVGMRAAPHTGIQMLGIQPKASHEGLQFYNEEKGWFFVDHSISNIILVNIGDMFAYLTSKKLPATLHRVVNSSSNSHNFDRYAIVHFFHANCEEYLIDLDKRNKVKSGDWLIISLLRALASILHMSVS